MFPNKGSDLQDITTSSVLTSVTGSRPRLGEKTDLNDPEATLHWVSQQQSSLGPHLLVLLVDEPGHLLQTLLVVSLRTEVDDVGSQTGHAT